MSDVEELWDDTSRIEAESVRELRYVLSDLEMDQICDRALRFCEKSTGVTLYWYQREFAARMVRSILLEDGDEITALFSRQSGKTEAVAVVIVGLSVLLPTLAKIEALARDDRISKFRDGLWTGIFAPVDELCDIMYDRMVLRMKSETMAAVLADPDVDLELPKRIKCLDLENGSFVLTSSLAPQTKVEGKTLHVIIVEEAQEADSFKVEKSVEPMGAATNASIFKIGTPAPFRSNFLETIEHNRRHDLDATPKTRRHFEYDWKIAAAANPRYKAYVTKRRERLGYDSDAFRMAFRLHWILERTQFVAPEIVDGAGIKDRDHLRRRDPKNKKKFLTFVRPAYPSTQDRVTENQVAAIDFGKTNDSTVVTIGKVWWDNPVRWSGFDRYYLHVVNWLELVGDDHEKQYPQIIEFLQNYRLGKVIGDATGRGDPIVDRLRNDLDQYDIEVEGFVYSARSKHDAYMVLGQELKEGRLTYAAGPGARKQRKWKRFVQQMYDAEKKYRGKYMTVEAPRSKKKTGSRDKSHDDYVDSLMLLCWLVNGDMDREVEVSDTNPIAARFRLADGFRKAKAWWRDGIKNPRKFGRTTRRR